jgi:hypothetical protein
VNKGERRAGAASTPLPLTTVLWEEWHSLALHSILSLLALLLEAEGFRHR